ncbi:MAG: hypothetical protein IT486_07710 [Gammaproteobacteria bacterium]|nr:hypothetical protein [Gammaproteobacteria bacterium]
MCRLLPVLVAVSMLNACSFWGDDEAVPECESVEEYQKALQAAGLSVPPGLDKPDPSGRLDIPEGPLPDQPLSGQAACLQLPPSFFDKPLAVPPAD